jgi:hypothetical protein
MFDLWSTLNIGNPRELVIVRKSDNCCTLPSQTAKLRIGYAARYRLPAPTRNEHAHLIV